MRTALPNSATPCIGAYLGYGLDFSHLGLLARVSVCTAGFDNALLRASLRAYDAEVRLYHAWDAGSLSLGLGGGLSLVQQRFDAVGVAPDRTSATPFIELGSSLSVGLWAGMFAALDVVGETHFMRLAAPMQSDRAQAFFSLRTSLAVGTYF